MLYKIGQEIDAEDRELMINELLTVNCDCSDGDLFETELDEMTDNQLIMMHNASVLNEDDDDDVDIDDDDDVDDDDDPTENTGSGCGSRKKKMKRMMKKSDDEEEEDEEEEMKKKANMKKKMAKNENNEITLEDLPSDLQRIVRNSLKVEAKERKKHIDIILNAEGNIFSEDYLNEMDIEDLQGIAELVPQQSRQTQNTRRRRLNQPRIHFPKSSPERKQTRNNKRTDNQQSDTVLMPPTMNFEKESA